MKLTKVFNLYNAIRLLAAAAVIYGIYILVKPEHYRNKKEHFAAFDYRSFDQYRSITILTLYYKVGTLQTRLIQHAEAINGGEPCPVLSSQLPFTFLLDPNKCQMFVIC